VIEYAIVKVGILAINAEIHPRIILDGKQVVAEIADRHLEVPRTQEHVTDGAKRFRPGLLG
jgi:hypothetical protein